MTDPVLKKQKKSASSSSEPAVDANTTTAPAPPAKASSSSASIVQGSRVFQPYRAVGFICGEVPAVVHNRGAAFFVTTCTGNNFQIYDCDKLGLLFVSPQTDLPITALAADGDLTYAATGPHVLVFKRAKLVILQLLSSFLFYFSSPPHEADLEVDLQCSPGFFFSSSLLAVQKVRGSIQHLFAAAARWTPAGAE